MSQLDEESSEGDKPKQIQDDVTDETNGSEHGENVGTTLSISSPRSVFKVPGKKEMRSSLAADEALHTQMQEAYSILKKR